MVFGRLNKRPPQSMGACCILQFVKQDLKAKQFNTCSLFNIFDWFSKLRLEGYVTIFFPSIFMDSRFSISISFSFSISSNFLFTSAAVNFAATTSPIYLFLLQLRQLTVDFFHQAQESDIWLWNVVFYWVITWFSAPSNKRLLWISAHINMLKTE